MVLLMNVLCVGGGCVARKPTPNAEWEPLQSDCLVVGSAYIAIRLNGYWKLNVSSHVDLRKPKPEHGELFFPPAEWIARRSDFIVYAFKEEDFSPVR